MSDISNQHETPEPEIKVVDVGLSERPNQFSVTIDLGRQVTPDGAGIMDLVVAQIVDQMMHTYGLSEDGDIYAAGKGPVAHAVTKAVTSRIDEAVRELTPDIVGRVLAQGVPKGSEYDPELRQNVPTFQPLSEYVEAYVRQQLTVRRENYGRRDQKSLLETVIEETVDKELRGELKKSVDEARSTVLQAVKTKAAEVLTETIERMATR